ncbi:MAG TPA: class I SAM-dependent methyltransferase [Kofleriaceae bacterium]|nr:class I SAM-dependent methyltransferase [Kofleriaceae bacterium]
MSARAVEMFANRVRKTTRHLGKWARRTGVTCWRVYDRDIPEVPVTVDTYEGALVVNDYRIDQADAGWLDAIAGAAKDALDARELFVKHRERLVERQAGHQYERLASTGAWRTVREGGHDFRVNLSDYVDTGLFLDHRITRARVAAEPARTMLNLFGYTGAFAVYAAAAGMRTTSVDLSSTYLAWARDNLAQNALDGELVQADVRAFLADARRAGRRWDLAVVDPPTFSNSKRMAYTFDVQRDHAALLADVRAVTTHAIWFSTNRKRFKLSLELERVTDETAATTPPDFHHRPHVAFRIALG